MRKAILEAPLSLKLFLKFQTVAVLQYIYFIFDERFCKFRLTIWNLSI